MRMGELKETGRDNHENAEEICKALLLQSSFSRSQNINIQVGHHVLQHETCSIWSLLMKKARKMYDMENKSFFFIF
jgi:hypothetical protein